MRANKPPLDKANMMHENNKPISPSQRLDDEASPIDVINFLRTGWKWLLGFAAIGTLCGLASSFLMNPVYEASATVQVAKVADEPVESPQFLVEKMKLPMFYSKSAISGCAMGGASQPGLALASALKISVNKAAPIVQIRFLASTPQKASGCLSAVVDDIRTQQRERATPLINKLKLQMTQLEQRLAELSKVSSNYQPVLPRSKSEGIPLAVSSLILSTAMNQLQGAAIYRERIDSLKVSLEPPDTQDAYPIFPIYAPNDKVSPNRLLWGVVVGIGGMVFGFLALLSRNALRRRGGFEQDS